MCSCFIICCQVPGTAVWTQTEAQEGILPLSVGCVGSKLVSRKTAQEQWASPSAGNLEEEHRLHASCCSASPTSGQLRARLIFPEIILLEAVLESLTSMVLPPVIPSQVPFSNRIKEYNLNCISIFPALYLYISCTYTQCFWSSWRRWRSTHRQLN